MARDQRRLGRGLSSLISSSTSAPPPEPSADAIPAESATLTRSIPVKDIVPNPKQPRRSFDQERLQSLADSLKRNGTLQPVVVRPKQGGKFELVAGERRWRAAQLAEIDELPAIIRHTDDESLLELALIENIQREDLNAVERAKAYMDLATRFQLTHEDIAQRMGENRSNVTNYIRLLDLDDETLALLEAGKLTMGHARCLVSVNDSKRRSVLAEAIVENGLSVRQAEELAKQPAGQSGKSGSPFPPATPPRPLIADLERRMREAIGLKARIIEAKRRKNTGKIVIEYHSIDDFERITSMLGVTDE